MKFYVRGRPIIVTVDDEFMFDKKVIQFNRTTDLAYGDINPEHPSLWGPLLEKAWAKLNLDYENTGGGHTA